MNDFFGIGIAELIVILIIAGLFLEPRQIRGLARMLGRFLAQMQGIMYDFRRQINAELDALDDAEMKEAIADLRQLQQQVDELRRQVNHLPQELINESRRAAAEVERGFKPRSAVPEEAAAGQPQLETPAGLPRPIEVPDDPVE
jgi:Sec-independent protein translocase protein TatA